MGKRKGKKGKAAAVVEENEIPDGNDAAVVADDNAGKAKSKKKDKAKGKAKAKSKAESVADASPGGKGKAKTKSKGKGKAKAKSKAESAADASPGGKGKGKAKSKGKGKAKVKSKAKANEVGTDASPGGKGKGKAKGKAKANQVGTDVASVENMKKKEVQAELAKLGLPTKGRLADLKEALQEARQMAEADGDGGDAGDSDAPTRQKSKGAKRKRDNDDDDVAAVTDEAAPAGGAEKLRQATEDTADGEESDHQPSAKRRKGGAEGSLPTATSDLAPAPSAGQGATRPAPSTADVGGPDGGSDSSSNDPFENVAARLHRTARSDCPYLDTINRAILDFDFKVACSVTLAEQNVYACLVCSKYFQGRGRSSAAYFHALQADHHVFIHMETLKVYCLPDGYEVVDNSLNDIRQFINPVFSPEAVASLDAANTKVRSIDGESFLPGFVGLNNLSATDYINVVVQALAHVRVLRDYFLRPENYTPGFGVVVDPLVDHFGRLLRKMWNPRGFRGHVSPHELVQAISTASDGRFTSLAQCDPQDLLTWFLNALQRALKTMAKSEKRLRKLQAKQGVAVGPLNDKLADNVVFACFQGLLRVTHEVVSQEARSQRDDAAAGTALATVETKVADVNFLHLTLDLPPAPLYKDQYLENVIQQVPIHRILTKYDGVKTQIMLNEDRKRFKVVRLPEYVIFYVARFTRNNYVVEKNPSLVVFSVNDLDLSPYLESLEGDDQDAVYDLVANVFHTGGVDDGMYRVHVRNVQNDQWYGIDDLTIEGTVPQEMVLSEACILIYERKRARPGDSAAIASVATTSDTSVAPMDAVSTA